ncbi:hypothetical protein [Catenulispora pinisilvae]|uniref:hypothetical protein n=1 Tax=Catenulispora pinisilvae TaxID=2705253 RepID=UPI0018928179|nr:hypothetical protein [Catenulispora pinisilvae]
MTTTPEQPPSGDDESGAADDRFDRRIAFGVVAALAVVGSVGPFGWHLLSNGSGSSKGSSGVVAAGNGGAGSNGNAAVANPAAVTSSPSASASPSASPTTGGPAAGASASCAAALGNASSVSNGSGTMASIGGWAIMATPSVNALRSDAATLHGIVLRQDAAAVPAAAKALCDQVASEGQLAAMPDTVGATAWQAALSAYVAGATDALAAATNHPAYYQAAEAQLAQGGLELDALSARIIATTQR